MSDPQTRLRRGTVGVNGDRTVAEYGVARSLGTRGRPIEGSEGAIEQVAASDATVLILGERGVGHEEVARTVHRLSARRDRPYEEVNCAVPVERLDQELFGESRRSASGARGTAGKLVLAHTGTIFLDDVGELPSAVQRKLLLVLQERQVTQAGADEPVTVDVRVLAATRRDLRPQVERGGFRQDLYYRLNVLRLYVRPLRQRRDEIPELARYYLEKYSRRHGRGGRVLSPATLERLMRHHWPGNLSELENLMERVVVLNSEHVVAEELDGAPAAPRATETARPRPVWGVGCVITPRTTTGGSRRRNRRAAGPDQPGGLRAGGRQPGSTA
jgi:two-component system NtrC family response regulator